MTDILVTQIGEIIDRELTRWMNSLDDTREEKTAVAEAIVSELGLKEEIKPAGTIMGPSYKSYDEKRIVGDWKAVSDDE